MFILTYMSDKYDGCHLPCEHPTAYTKVSCYFVLPRPKSIHLSVCPFIHPSIHPSIHACIHQPCIHPPIIHHPSSMHPSSTHPQIRLLLSSVHNRNAKVKRHSFFSFPELPVLSGNRHTVNMTASHFLREANTCHILLQPSGLLFYLFLINIAAVSCD